MQWDRVHSGGYVFQIETTYLASRAGAKVVETPIVFTDRRVGVSKMSRRIIGEALMVVIRLRWDELRGRGPTTTATQADSTDVAGATGATEAGGSTEVGNAPDPSGTGGG